MEEGAEGNFVVGGEIREVEHWRLSVWRFVATYKPPAISHQPFARSRGKSAIEGMGGGFALDRLTTKGRPIEKGGNKVSNLTPLRFGGHRL